MWKQFWILKLVSNSWQTKFWKVCQLDWNFEIWFVRFDREAVDSPPFVMDNHFFSTASDGYMVLWTLPLSCVLELLCKMGSSGLLRNCGLLEPRKSPRDRFDAGFWALKTFSNQNRISDGAKPFRNGRMVTKFGIFFALKSAVLSKTDIQSHEDSAHFFFRQSLKKLLYYIGEFY